MTLFNLVRGRRDMKMLQGTRETGTPIWELRHHDSRLAIRLLFVRKEDRPRVVAVMAKVDEAQQRRLIERINGWAL